MQASMNAVKIPSCTRLFQPIEHETRSHVETACAAFHLMRKEQTLRVWATYGKGAIRPIRINGRLAWPVSDIKCLLSGGK